MVILGTGAEHIEYEPLVLVVQAKLLGGQKGDVAHRTDLGREEGVEEMNQIVLVLLRTEETLETEIGKQIDVTLLIFHKNNNLKANH